MSAILEGRLSTTGKPVRKTVHFSGTIFDGQNMVKIGDDEFHISDLLGVVKWLLTNHDIEGLSDPRLDFVEGIKKYRLVEGSDPSRERIELP